jgi:hypothetical protein
VPEGGEHRLQVIRASLMSYEPATFASGAAEAYNALDLLE